MTERSVVEVLRAARERISDPERWTTDAYARTVDGLKAEPHAESACMWCAAGSLFCEVGVGASSDDPAQPISRVPGFDHLIAAAFERGREISHINDHQGHSEVLALYDRAIELAEGKS